MPSPWQCDGGVVHVAKCRDKDCSKCSEARPNPYGYAPGKCVSDFLRVVCTSEMWEGAKKPAGTSKGGSSSESKAKARIKALTEPNEDTPEGKAKARIKLLSGGHDEL